MRRVSAIVLIVIVLFSAVTATARVLNIPLDFQTIQAGIDSAGAGDTVLVQPGRYDENLHFSGRAIVVASCFLNSRNPAYIDSTIIDGGGRSSVVRFTRHEDSTTALIGFTITNGSGSPDQSGDNAGGGIHCHQASPYLSHLKITGNRVERYGGGMFVQSESSPIIENTLISENTAGYFGGGLYCSRQSSPILRRVVFSGNQSMDGSAVSLFMDCRPIIQNCTFSNNSCDGRGSVARMFWTCEMNLVNCIISANDPDSISLTGDPAGNTLNIAYSLLTGGESMVSVSDTSTETVHWLEGNLDANPLFINPDNCDYRLRMDSPCIDAGDSEAPLDPDGTRADMGAFEFHQKDIEVHPREITFEALPFGARDSQLVVVTNTGETDLTIRVEEAVARSAISMREAEVGEIAVPANTGVQLWAIYHAQELAQESQRFIIMSDDPDEPEITIEASIYVDGVPSDRPQSAIFNLQSAYPNPFNSSTTITFGLSKLAPTRIGIYGLDGRLIDEMDLGKMEAGEHTAVWNAQELPGGMYIIKLDTDEGARTLKAILLR